MNWAQIVLKSVLLLLVAAGVRNATAQTVYDATEGSLPLRVGAGISDYYTEIYPNHFKGPTVWADWTFRRVPKIMQGIGIEGEGRELTWGQPKGSSWSFVTFGGGPIYSRTYHRVLRPYAKILVNYSEQRHIQGAQFAASYQADKWLTFAPGGGVDVHAWRHIWVRADYEYQFWKVMWTNDHFLNPQGVTLGLAYDFRVNRGARR